MTNASGLIDATAKGMHDLIQVSDSSDIRAWDDSKKKDFVKVFQTRARVTSYLLLRTAAEILGRAEARHFISAKHLGEKELAWYTPNDDRRMRILFDDPSRWSTPAFVGGRDTTELDKLALERAEAILNELPSARAAAAVIMPDIARKMDRRDVLLSEGRKLQAEVVALSQPICLTEQEDSMTIGAFKKLVEKKTDERDALLKKLSKIGVEGCTLESAIDKALYDGFPGLSEAVIRVASQHNERVTMLDQMCRRVEEKVLFGDSLAAMEILQRFEKDEASISEEVQSEFKKALTALNLAGKQRRKLKANSK